MKIFFSKSTNSEKNNFREKVDLKSFTGFSFKEKGFGFKNPMILIIKESFYWNVFVKKKKTNFEQKELKKRIDFFFFKVSMGFIFREKGLDPKTHVFYCS